MLRKRKQQADVQDAPAAVDTERRVEDAHDSSEDPTAENAEEDVADEQPDDKPTDDGTTAEEDAGTVEPADGGAVGAAEAFGAWLEENVTDEEVRRDALSAMSKIVTAVSTGVYGDAFFRIVSKGADYDRAVREAEENGEIRGRNASIDELMADEYGDDGVPHPSQSGGGSCARAASIFDIAREAY